MKNRKDSFASYLSDTEPFILDGRHVNNLKQLCSELKKTGEDVFSQYCNAGKNDFYSWIKGSIGDRRLARDIMNIRLRENMIKIIGERVLQLEDYARHPQKSVIEKRIDMYSDHVLFTIDNEICSDCEICSLVCPKEAVEIKERKKTVNDDCTKCGFCVNFCPLQAMSIDVNGEKRDFFKQNDMLPEFPEPQKIHDVSAIRLFKGVHNVKDKCPPGCELCVRACPVNALSRFEGKRELDRVRLDKSGCILCGACKNACPYGLIEIGRAHINYSGEGYSNVWNRAIEKLTTVEKKNLYHNNKNINKIKTLIESSGLNRYNGLTALQKEKVLK